MFCTRGFVTKPRFLLGGFRFDDIFQDRMAAIHFMQILACSNDPMSVFCQKGLFAKAASNLVGIASGSLFKLCSTRHFASLVVVQTNLLFSSYSQYC